jgi:hypothetical protein
MKVVRHPPGGAIMGPAVRIALRHPEDSMTVRRALGLLLALALVAAAARTAEAVGPLDGSYPVTITITGEDIDPFLWYVVVLQRNNTEFGMALLDPETAYWYYGFGPLDGNLHVAGPILDPQGTQLGQFDLQFQGSTLTGSLTLYDIPFTLKGDKFF